MPAHDKLRQSWWIWPALWLFVLASRLPFLDAGFGWDEDAWGNVVAASRFAETGIFAIPRPPGFPLLQWIQSFLWHGGPLWINGATAVMSAFAAVGFALFTRKLGLSILAAVAAGMALAFTPVVYLNSTNAMDYVWALAFGLWAFCFGAARRPALAGLLLGCAIGCRITSALLLIPLAFLCMRTNGRGSAIRLLTMSVVTAFACYLPVWRQQGLSFIAFSGQPFRAFAPYLLHHVTMGLWGILGFLSLVLALLLAVWGGDRVVPVNDRRFLSRLSLGTIALYTLLFLRLPAEAAYLIPAIPFVLLWLAIRLHPVLFLGLALDLVLSSFLFWIPVDYEGLSPAPAVEQALPRSVARRARLARHWGKPSWAGPVLHTHARRLQQVKARDAAVRAIASLPMRPLAVNAGGYLDFFLADISIRKKLPPDEVTFTNTAASYTVRGFRNCPAIGFGVVPPVLKIDRFEEGDPENTPLDVALINTVARFPDQPVLDDVLDETEFYVPFLRASISQPFLVRYNHRVGLPVFDRAGRAAFLQPWERWIEFKRMSGSDLASGAVPIGLLLVNPGGPTEFEWPVGQDIFQ